MKGLGLQAMKVVASAADRLQAPPRGAVVLAYHRVGSGCGQELDVPTGTFADQMALLARTRRAASLDEVLEATACVDVPSVDPVAVTFDDGTADFVDNALAAIVENQVPVTYYVATEFIETGAPFPYGGRPLTWAALAEAVSTGLVTVGSHTHRHRLLDRLDQADIDDELDRSRELIGERLGVTCRHFAYPKGQARTALADAAVRARFRSAALGVIRANVYGGTDPHRLGRAPIQRGDKMTWFRRKLDGGLRLEGTVRERVNDLRYASVET